MSVGLEHFSDRDPTEYLPRSDDLLHLEPGDGQTHRQIFGASLIRDEITQPAQW
jgi:hypothetical protein